MYLIFTHFIKLISATLNYLVNIPEKKRGLSLNSGPDNAGICLSVLSLYPSQSFTNKPNETEESRVTFSPVHSRRSLPLSLFISVHPFKKARQICIFFSLRTCLQNAFDKVISL